MKRLEIGLAVAASALFAACGGGGGSSPPPPMPAQMPTAPMGAPTAAPQVIRMALPTTSIGMKTDPTYGLIGGYTQQTYSQILGFVPGAQVMISNGELAEPHTLNVLSQTAFPTNPTLSTAASGGSTLAAGFATGSVNGGASVGPITLSAGLYYIGCAFHYTTNTMRTVLNVAANAVPGPQATPMPGAVAPPSGFGY
jgi:hypothetical protein